MTETTIDTSLLGIAARPDREDGQTVCEYTYACGHVVARNLGPDNVGVPEGLDTCPADDHEGHQ